MILAFDDAQVVLGQHRLHGPEDLFFGAGHRVADVDGQLRCLRFDFRHAQVEDHFPGFFILKIDAQCGAVQDESDVFIIESDEVIDFFIDKIQAPEEFHHDGHGVEAALRFCPVGGNAHRGQLQGFAHALARQLISGLFPVCCGFLLNGVICTCHFASHHSPAPIRHAVWSCTAGKGAEHEPLGSRLVLSEFLRQIEDQHALFAVDHREIRIRRKAVIRPRRFFEVVVHALPGGLFIQTQDDPDRVFRLESGVLQGLHGIEAGNHRPFVIGGSAAIDIAVFHFAAVRFKVPAAAGRHHVQMAQDGHDLRFFMTDDLPLFIQNVLSASRPVDVTAVVVHIAGLESQAARQFQTSFKAVLHPLPKGINFPVLRGHRIRLLGIETDQLLQGFCHRLLVFFQKRFVLLKFHFPVHRILLMPILRNPHFLPETGKLRKPAFHHFACAAMQSLRSAAFIQLLHP